MILPYFSIREIGLLAFLPFIYLFQVDPTSFWILSTIKIFIYLGSLHMLCSST